MEGKHYIIENGCKISEVKILKTSSNLYTLKLIKSGQVLRLPKHRLMTEEEVKIKYPEVIQQDNKNTMRPPKLH